MKRIGLLCLALVLALGTLGIGYAHWMDTIYIEGQVTTGSLCWELTDCDLKDEIPPTNPGGDADVPEYLADYTCNNGFAGDNYWRLDKNVAWGTQNISADGKTITVTLNNAYPCYFNGLTIYVKNCGTVPMKIDHVVINGQTYTGGVPYVQYDFNGDGAFDFELSYKDNFGAQLDPGEDPLEISMWMHVLQPCPQSQLDTLTFNITLVAVQWNGYPLPG